MHKLQNFASFIDGAGGEAFLVGGVVRDGLLDLPSKDVDIEVFGISEETLVFLLKSFSSCSGMSFKACGKSFKVFKLGGWDVSLPRRDKKTGSGHKGFEVTSDHLMSKKEAASRRDFTINTLMKNILTGEVIDPTGFGMDDIKNKKIRMVDKNAFTEDPLRVLRALQFAARFGFGFDHDTLLEMTKVDLTELPAERVFTELEKALLQSDEPSKMFLWTFVNKQLFPEISALFDVPQEQQWHPEGNVYVHTMMVIDEAAKLIKNSELAKPEKVAVMLAALFHDLGKLTTTEFIDGRWRALGHSEAGLPLATEMLNRLNVWTMDGFDVRNTVLALIEHHLAPPQLFDAKQKDSGFNEFRAVRRLSTKVRLDLLAMVSLADLLGRGTDEKTKERNKVQIAWFLEQAEKVGTLQEQPQPLLMGRDLIALGMKPSELFGEILGKAFELQLDGKLNSHEEAVEWFKRYDLELISGVYGT